MYPLHIPADPVGCFRMSLYLKALTSVIAYTLDCSVDIGASDSIGVNWEWLTCTLHFSVRHPFDDT